MNYTVLATSQEGQDTVPDTSGMGRPIGSTGKGYKVLAEGAALDLGEPQAVDDTVSLGDVIQDTLHIAGSDNGDFFGGSDANERLGLGIKEASGWNKPISEGDGVIPGLVLLLLRLKLI